MTAFKNIFSPSLAFLYLFLLDSSACQRITNTGVTRNLTNPGFNHIQFVRPSSGGGDADIYRLKRGSNTSRKIADIAARLNKEKETEPKQQSGVHVDETAAKLRLLGRNQSDKEYNIDQEFNKKNDRIRVLHSRNMQDKQYFADYNCNFENDCKWTWRKDIANGFYITTGGDHLKGNDTGPKFDANKRQFGSYLILRPPPKSKEFHVTSPLFGPTTSACKLTFDVYQENMKNGTIRVIGDKTIDNIRGHPLNNHTQWVVHSFGGNNNKEWKKEDVSLGKITTNFTILIEVVAPENLTPGATVAFDNLQLYECFAKTDETCSPQQYRCNRTKDCVNSTTICDFNQDCPHGDDETLNCHMMPYGSRCTFEENDWCGWTNADDKNVLKWARHNGSTPNNFTGPHYDHTFLNSSGNYLYVNMLNEKSSFASQAVLRSVIFNPPPRVHGNSSSRYFNTCAIRFYLHKTGKHKSAILIQVNEMTPTENKTMKIYWSYMEDHGDQWIRQVFVLPNITNRYFMHFEAKKGYRYLSDIAVDDVSLSPECFGINIPEDELQGYNYWNPKLDVAAVKETVDEYKNKTYYKITTCNNTGRYGPTREKCNKAYNGTSTSTRVLHDAGLSGVQKWIVPEDNHYTFILAGASGGKGSSGMGSSRGAVVRTVMELSRGQEIFLMVGQEGSGACLKLIGQINNCSTLEDAKQKPQTVLIRDILTLDIIDNGGGGGGGTFLFLRNRTKDSIPIAVAAGGGGLGPGRFFDNGKFHGRGFIKRVPVSGSSFGLKGAGAGGGWRNPIGMVSHHPMTGGSLLMGGIGGKACYNSYNGKGDGGFGGGGSGCRNGGGGGGFAGGNANTTNGDGGISYVDTTKTVAGFAKAEIGQNVGPGYVVIIPAIDGCDCDYHCIALDEKRSEPVCICPQTWKLSDNKKSCIPIMINRDPSYPPWFVVVLIVTVFCLTFLFGLMCFILYNRYQQQVSGLLRRKGCPVSDVQLNRLRHASGSVTTQYNPNYEFGGVVTTISDLQHIPRDQLRLVKALGQGAFGEVYQGFYRQRPCDTVEMPVAVKTLAEMTVKQNEDDFLTEALIMSKFNHPNIVHFIGVCFDMAPKFIVLELLTGGDLKNFLRESRAKPDRPSSITMKDLVFIAIDIARGCRYLEEKRFIHRDIAARNCLLTTKGPGRVAKIADFGMSRDIYRADYYRKDGKAMLPVKWMPPEAFLEGIFSSKTDVWSFGILLWEILKMGFMPYTGCTNKEVMDLVMQGGRLERPKNCPGPIYGIMASWWHPQPEDRPSFATILERLGYCSQDPDVINAPLPVFYGGITVMERDATIIRPSDSNDNCLQVFPNNPSNYLVPNHTQPSTPEVIESTSSVEKLIPDGGRNLTETSFMLSNSRSTQPLLESASSREEDVTHTSCSVHNPNFVSKNEPATTVKSGISLDPSALAKSLMTPNQKKKRYANVDENASIRVQANGGHSMIRLAAKTDDEIIHC